MGTGGLALRRLRAKVVEKPTGFVWVEKGRVAGSGYPASRGQLEWLRDQGVNTIVTLTERGLPSRWLEGLPLEVNHIPMSDHAAPDPASLERAASLVQEKVAGGRTVLVHCLAGEGRTGCVLAAYLVIEKGISGEEAIRVVRVAKNLFVEREQEGAVIAYGLLHKPKA